MYRAPDQAFESGECVQANYSIREDGYIRIYNSE